MKNKDENLVTLNATWQEFKILRYLIQREQERYPSFSEGADNIPSRLYQYCGELEVIKRTIDNILDKNKM